MNVEDIVLNHLLDIVSVMEDGDFEISKIDYVGFQKTWESICNDNEQTCRNIGKAFKKLVDEGKIPNVTYKETLTNHHNIYLKNKES